MHASLKFYFYGTDFTNLLHYTDKKEVPAMKSGEEKPRSKLRLVLKPLPNDEEDPATGDHPTKPEGCCGDTCTGGQEITAESASEKCSEKESMFSASADESTSCRDGSESQLPLPSSQGTFVSIDTFFNFVRCKLECADIAKN